MTHRLSLGGEYAARAVRLTFQSNWFDAGLGGDRVGLAELKFVGAVPEPATFVLAALGLVALGLVGWRRRKPA